MTSIRYWRSPARNYCSTAEDLGESRKQNTFAPPGNLLSPALQLPVTWEEFTSTSDRRPVRQRAQAMALDLHASYNQSLYWIRTGFLPTTQRQPS